MAFFSNFHPRKSQSKKCYFFHTYFVLYINVHSNTCLRVMILFFKENLIFLNTFLAIFCYKTNFCCLSVSINQKCSTKIRLHMTYVPAYFCVVLSNNFDFFNLRDTKNHFHHKILLEMCSETSNSPSNTVSWSWDRCFNAYGRIMQKIKKNIKCYILEISWKILLKIVIKRRAWQKSYYKWQLF